MDQQTPSYRREFFRSKHHVWLALTTLGGGFILGADRPLFLLIGAAFYALGWIYLPDMSFFKRAVDRRLDSARNAEVDRQLVQFQQQRDALLASLSGHLRRRYHELAEVCREIEQAGAESVMGGGGISDPRLHKLDELMWTFLRMLAIQDSFERFLETERREDVPGRIRDAEADVAVISGQIDELRKDSPVRAVKEQLRQSRLEALEVLRKRRERIEHAQANLALVISEQGRLDNQIKLLRADAVAARNTSGISARIDATVEHLEQTSKWLAEMGEFEDLVGNIPSAERRVGYVTTPVPPRIQQGEKTRGRTEARDPR